MITQVHAMRLLLLPTACVALEMIAAPLPRRHEARRISTRAFDLAHAVCGREKSPDPMTRVTLPYTATHVSVAHMDV